MDTYSYDETFPFNLHVTSNRAVAAAGPSMVKLLGTDPAGLDIGHVLDLGTASGFDPAAAPRHWQGVPVSFQLVEPIVRMTGSFVPHGNDQNDRVVFVGTLAPEEVNRLNDLGLTGADFAPHDMCLEHARVIEATRRTVQKAEQALADLEEAQILKEALHRKAHTDTLTQVANRSAFVEALEEAVAKPVDPATQLSVMIVDIDRFKSINDLYGHLAGDETLKVVARHLCDSVGDNGLVARLGGDEFGILIPALPIEQDLTRLINKIVSIRGKTFRVDNANVEINITLGVVIRRTEKSGNDLLRHADIAMYEARRSQRKPVNIFNPVARRNLDIRRAIRRELPDALENNQIDLVYQPEVDLATGLATRLEAFVRWNHPEFGPLDTNMFIDEVERCQMNPLLHRYVLRRATTDALRHFKRDGELMGMSVNLSPLSITNTLSGDVEQVLGLTGFPADMLVLEVAEVGGNHDMQRIASVLHDLVAIGVTITIDDFGTGHSSLKNLSQLPIGGLKMDGSFTSSISTSRKALELVRATLQICQMLNLPVVAEGVETAEHAHLFGAMGFEYGQGFYFGLPGSLEQTVAILDRPLPTQLRRSTDSESITQGEQPQSGLDPDSPSLPLSHQAS